jgi:antirestriction protein
LITEQRLQPRIYVASLSDYNAGRLHGRWIDATQDREAILNEIEAMLGESPEAVAEEFAIHDYDDFGGIRLGEWEDLDHVCKLAAALVAHGPAFATWYGGADVNASTSLAEQFQEAYCGEFTSLADYAEELATETGEVTETQLAMWPYTCINWERAGRELEFAGDIWSAVAPLGRVWIFR